MFRTLKKQPPSDVSETPVAMSIPYRARLDKPTLSFCLCLTLSPLSARLSLKDNACSHCITATDSFYQNDIGISQPHQPSTAPAPTSHSSQAPPTAAAGNPLLNNQEEEFINSFFMSHSGGQEMSTVGFDLAIQQAADQLHGANMPQFGWLMNEQPPTFVNASATPKQTPAPMPYQHMAHHGSLDFGNHFSDGSDMLSNTQYQHMLAQSNMMQHANMGHGQMHPPPPQQQHAPSMVSAPHNETSDMMPTANALTGMSSHSSNPLLGILPGTTVTAREIRDLLDGHNVSGTFNSLTPINTDHDVSQIQNGPHTAPARLDEMADGRLYRFGSDSHFGLDGFKPSSITQDHNYIANRLTEELHMLKPINRSNVPTRASSPNHHLSQLAANHARKRSAAHMDGVPVIKDEIDEANHISRPKKRRKDDAISDSEDVTASPATKRKFSTAHPRIRRVSSTATGDMSPGGGGASKRRRSSVSGTNKAASRENLSEEQKRSNHIQSEQKRRNLIKQGFDELRRIVPELRGGGLSKSMELMEVSNFLEQVINANVRLRGRLGIPAPSGKAN